MLVPADRGPLSRAVGRSLRTGGSADCAGLAVPPRVSDDGDAQLALWMLYELHYRGFEDAAADLEWDPGLLALRGELERVFEAELRELTADLIAGVPHVVPVGQAVLELADGHDGPSVAAYLHRHATEEQLRDYLRERSVTQMQESDPHSFVLGRLDGPAKVALAELQYDEYGGGDPVRLHSLLYAQAMTAMGLTPAPGAYLDTTAPATLAAANAMSLFALHRRLSAAAMGHLAAFEATSSVPCRKIAAGIERLGLGADVSRYFLEHVEADAVHEHLAAHDICGPIVAAHPELRGEVLFGAATCLLLEDRCGHELLGRWKAAA